MAPGETFGPLSFLVPCFRIARVSRMARTDLKHPSCDMIQFESEVLLESLQFVTNHSHANEFQNLISN